MGPRVGGRGTVSFFGWDVLLVLRELTLCQTVLICIQYLQSRLHNKNPYPKLDECQF